MSSEDTEGQNHFAQRIIHGVGIAICVLITIIIAMRLRS